MTKNKTSLQITLIVGRKNSGKTAYLEEIYHGALKKGLQVGGFLSKAQWDGNRKTRYFLHNLQNGEKHLLAWQSAAPSPLHAGQFAFLPETFEWGFRFVQNQLHLPVIIMDEFGPLEMRQQGWYDLLRFLATQYSGFLFISVRPDLVDALLRMIKGWD